MHQHERDECKGRFRRIAVQYNMNILSIEIDIDHIHIYIQIPPKIAVNRAVRMLKSLSARFMFQRFPYLKQTLWAGNLWEASYFARSVGEGVTGDMAKR